MAATFASCCRHKEDTCDLRDPCAQLVSQEDAVYHSYLMALEVGQDDLLVQRRTAHVCSKHVRR